MRRTGNETGMDEPIRTILIDSLRNCQPGSLTACALNMLYTQWAIIPLQRAWKRKDHVQLRQKYICRSCKECIKYEVNKYQCWACSYKEKYIYCESERLDSFVY